MAYPSIKEKGMPIVTRLMRAFSSVQELICTEWGMAFEAVTLSSRFAEDLQACGPDVIALAWALGEHFDIDIPNEDVEKFVTVEDAVKYVLAH